MERVESLGIENYIIYQDDGGYCFTSDAVLLSKFAKAKAGDIVADFCSGSGIVGIHFYLLNKNVKSVDLFEMQENLYSLSVKTVVANGLEGKIIPHNVRLQDISNEYNEKFSLILVNPPYMPVNDCDKTPTSIEICKEEYAIKLQELITISAKKLKYGGRLNMVHRADRLAEIIYFMKSCNIEPKRMQLVSGSEDKSAYLVLIEGVKGGKPGLKIEKELINRG